MSRENTDSATDVPQGSTTKPENSAHLASKLPTPVPTPVDPTPPASMLAGGLSAPDKLLQLLPAQDTMAVIEEYPHFKTGDVMIVAPTGRTWKVHNFYLRNASQQFRNLLTEKNAHHVTKKQKFDGKMIQWKFNMVVLGDGQCDRFVKFKPLNFHVNLPRQRK